MTLKEYIVVNHGDAGVCLWIREQWLTHLADARKTSPGYNPPIITTFNADEQLQEQKGVRWVKAAIRLPDLWVHNPTSSKRLNLRLSGLYPKVGRYVKAGREEYFILEDNARFEKESFHLFEWLEETEPGQPVPAGEWISVDESLPEMDEEVMACSEFDNWIVIAFRKKTRWFNSWEAGYQNAIPIFPTHWRPLPAPPSPKQDNP